MTASLPKLTSDALAIWQAGLRAVLPETLLPEYVAADDRALWLGDEEIPLDAIGRIFVVGAGKAGAGMALALEKALGPRVLAEKRVSGLVNVPADCVTPTTAIRLHAARPPGANEPTAAGVAGAQAMLDEVARLQSNDVCIALISGGGSALLPLPTPGLDLADKVAMTRALSARGATIDELNAVRRELSQIKGGGLARACRAGRLTALVLSDVLGDDLATIASGPTLVRQPTPLAAIEILEAFGVTKAPFGQRIAQLLKQMARRSTIGVQTIVQNVVIGNNATAVDAAGVEAERLGYHHAMICATSSEGSAEEVAAHLTRMAQRMRSDRAPDCLISGGEPTVTLAEESERGQGGRNQQLCLAALATESDWRGMALVSGGTDGEDGPTDAAGAMVDEQVATRARTLGLDVDDFLRRNDAYCFFAAVDGLLQTGPTHTNVCDVRVITTQGGTT